LTPNVIVSIKLKLAAFAVAVGIISILVYHYGFNNYVAIAGIVAYIIAKACCGYHARYGAADCGE
jgi:hypothetical protein